MHSDALPRPELLEYVPAAHGHSEDGEPYAEFTYSAAALPLRSTASAPVRVQVVVAPADDATAWSWCRTDGSGRKDPPCCGPPDHDSVLVLESIESRGRVDFPWSNMLQDGLMIGLG